MVRGDHVRGAIVVVATLCLLGMVSPLSAAPVTVPVSYELRLSENAYVTVDPTNASVLQQVGNVSQHELFSMRDMPYLQLINTSFGTPGAEITLVGDARCERVQAALPEIEREVGPRQRMQILRRAPGQQRCAEVRQDHIAERLEAIGAEVHLPFGGTKATGNGHREAGQAALDFYTEWKSVYIDYSGKLQRAQIDTTFVDEG